VLCSFSLHINNTTFICQSSRDSHTSHFHTPSTSVKMQYSILALASAASYVSAQSLSTPSASASAIGAVVPLGKVCDPGTSVCALGSSCYAVNSMLQPVCGNFQAQCTSDQQCAFNTCDQNGFCAGFLSSSSSASATITSTSAGGYTPAPSSTVTATSTVQPTGSLVPSGSATATTTSATQFTGAASVANVANGVAAVVLGAVALVL
jgi:hypothetical protein